LSTEQKNYWFNLSHHKGGKMKKLTILFLSLFFVTHSVFASGFQINEHGAKAMALGGAFTGLANDASAVYFNPAALSFMNGTHVLGGVTLIMPSATWKAPGGAAEQDMESQTFTPINFYLTHQFSDKVAAGLSVNNQYGLGTEWDPTWAGRYLAYDTEIVTFFITGVISYKFSEQFSLAAGVTYAIGNVTINQVRNISLLNPVVPPGTLPDFQTKMDGDGNSLGFTVGLMFKPSEEVSLGLTFRSESKFDFEGDAVSTPASQTLPDFFPPPYGGLTIPLPSGKLEAPLTTPMNITFGLGWMASDKVNVSADFQYVGWSSYDKLEVTFTEYAVPPATPPTVVSAERKYENSFIVRAGCEYEISNNFDLRGGLLYDKNPIKDEYVEPTLPDADRIGLNIGFGYDFGNGLIVDFAYMYLLFMEREVTNSHFGFNGTYNNNAHLIGLNLGYAIN
jgi:long-chain fatty acid transport protein